MEATEKRARYEAINEVALEIAARLEAAEPRPARLELRPIDWFGAQFSFGDGKVVRELPAN